MFSSKRRSPVGKDKEAARIEWVRGKEATGITLHEDRGIR